MRHGNIACIKTRFAILTRKGIDVVLIIRSTTQRPKDANTQICLPEFWDIFEHVNPGWSSRSSAQTQHSMGPHVNVTYYL